MKDYNRILWEMESRWRIVFSKESQNLGVYIIHEKNAFCLYLLFLFLVSFSLQKPGIVQDMEAQGIREVNLSAENKKSG